MRVGRQQHLACTRARCSSFHARSGRGGVQGPPSRTRGAARSSLAEGVAAGPPPCTRECRPRASQCQRQRPSPQPTRAIDLVRVAEVVQVARDRSRHQRSLRSPRPRRRSFRSPPSASPFRYLEDGLLCQASVWWPRVHGKRIGMTEVPDPQPSSPPDEPPDPLPPPPEPPQPSPDVEIGPPS